MNKSEIFYKYNNVKNFAFNNLYMNCKNYQGELVTYIHIYDGNKIDIKKWYIFQEDNI